MSRTPRILVVGAGVGGLAAAARLAARGFETTVLERGAAPGGKMRAVEVEGAAIDAGPTVFTMRFVFDELFADCGQDFAASVRLAPIETLARHFWRDGSRLDLFRDVERSAEAIRDFAGVREAEGYRDFARRAERAYLTLRDSFIRASRPNPPQLVARILARRPADLFAFSPFDTLWRGLQGHFRDLRLRQLFARYSTYCGSSPYAAPATLMLVAHVEREGVWIVEGGMRRLAAALANLAQTSGAKLRYGCDVKRILVERGRAAGVETAEGERIAADAVVFNGDVGALATGLLGEKVRRAGGRAPAPSLSAVTWGVKARADGAPWVHHNVLFGDDYREEFEAVFARGALPKDPTIYVCAQDRGEEAHDGLPVPSPLVGEGKGGGAAFVRPETAALTDTPHPGPPPHSPSLDGRLTTPYGGREIPDERLFVLVNAPAHRADAPLSSQEMERCEQATSAALSPLGVSLDWRRARRTTPADFSSMFPGSRGALYGPPSHGWRASFARAAARTALPGLYLAGGSVHPGPGVPMAALSGRQAALAVAADFSSTVKFRPAATPGGTWTRSATTDATG